MRTVHDTRGGNVCDPYDNRGGHTPLIDKMLGSAYDVVKYVARHLDAIRFVALNMETINEVATNMKTSGLVLGMTEEVGVTVSIALPDGITQGMVLSSAVLVQAPNGDVYGADSGHFTATIQAGALRLALKSTAPIILENAVVRWFITYGGVTNG